MNYLEGESMIKPMLAARQDQPFNDPGYIWETKLDGARIIAGVTNESYSLHARSGTNKTVLFPELHLETKEPAVLDGELVVFDEEGNIKFKGIQHRINRVNEIKVASLTYPATYMVFDVLSVGGQDVQQLPLMQRKQILNRLLIPTDNTKLVDYTDADGITLFQQIVGSQGEGVIGKLKDGKYRQNARDWIKVKAEQRGEFIVCGFTQGTGWRESTFGALVLAIETPGVLTYCGEVGTGFDMAELRRLHQKVLNLTNDVCPFGQEPLSAIWVRPNIRVKVNYLEMTEDGKLRFPSYKGEV